MFQLKKNQDLLGSLDRFGNSRLTVTLNDTKYTAPETFDNYCSAKMFKPTTI